jgi:hypothetical protein
MESIERMGKMEHAYPLYLSRCLTCGHVQLPVVVDPKLLFPADYPYASSTGASMREHLDSMARELERGVTRPPGLVAEIGSNDGYLLRQFAWLGHRTIGIDPATGAARKATESGALTIAEFFTPSAARAIFNACGPADLVVANNVFAHADNLSSIVEGVKILIGEAPDGRFVFEVGYLPDVLAANNWPTVYHEHLSYHTLLPLYDFFRHHGLNLYDAHRVDTQGGSIRCFVNRSDVASRSDRLHRLMENELPVADHWLPRWQSRVTTSAKQFAATLRSLKSQGKSIAGYGCSAKSTTLLHVAGIGRETIGFICDANPLKQGRYTPGKHIPIVHPDELEKRQPDVCVSLSENFTEAFVARHPGFRGEWLAPVLDLEMRAA